ncbi:allatostatin-A receptor-like isoform X1 [Branchiostoma lanceolatum]|uniref:allatostatin-A receptor-like isoform X1 n=1 Tax=Branchiostoma lanceolatum TaxID=7740 RepID=UPI003455A9AC
MDVTYIANVARCCISAVGMLANLLILFIVARYPTMRTIHNLYVANLAVADCCFCVFVIAQAAVSIRYRHLQGMLEDMVEEHCRQDLMNSTNFTTVTLTRFAPDLPMPVNCTEMRLDEESLLLLEEVKVEFDSALNVSNRSCDVGRVIAVFLAASSIFHLIAIACERYQAVTKPFTHRFNTTLKGAAKTCAKIWLGAFGTAVLDTLQRNIISRDWTFSYKSLYECVYLKPDDPDPASGYPYRALQLIIFVISYVVPACILIPVYAMIFFKLRRRRRRFKTGRTASRFAARRSSSKHHAIPMLFAVTVFFLVCWLPFHVTAFSIHSYVGDDNIAVVYVATALAVLNSVINPFLYAFIGRNFRKHIAGLFCRKKIPSSASERSLRMSSISVSRHSGVSNVTMTTAT